MPAAAVIPAVASLASTAVSMVNSRSRGGSGGGGSMQPSLSEIALAQISWVKWKLYKQDAIPFENEWLRDIGRPTGPKEAQIAGKLNADAMQKYGAGLLPEGKDPSSGQNESIEATTRFAKGLTTATNMSKEGVKDIQAKQLQTAVSLGDDQSDLIAKGYTSLAQDELQTAMANAYLDYKKESGQQQLLGQMTGLGLERYGDKILSGINGLIYPTASATQPTTRTASQPDSSAPGGWRWEESQQGLLR